MQRPPESRQTTGRATQLSYKQVSRNSSHCGIHLTRHAVARFERPLHPSVNPHRRVLTREMNPAFGPCDVWQQGAELAGLVISTSAARPFILIPAFRHAALEVLTH